MAVGTRSRAGGRTASLGSYDFGLREEGGRWLIDSFRFVTKFVDGNLELERDA